jgi:hypothetical protein
MKTRLLHETASRNRQWNLLRLLAALLMASLLQASARGGEPPSGTVVGWGDQVVPYMPPSAPFRAAAIAAGGNHSLALQPDGTVVAWGDNESGQSTVPANLSGVTAIAAGGEHSLALKSDGTVVAWGANNSGQSTVPGNLSGVIAIAAGSEHNLALKSDGTVVAWGRNFYGQSTVPAHLSGVIAIAAGGRHNLALVGDPPRLEIARAGDAVLLQWPATDAGYLLESTPTLTPPAWEIATEAPAMVADRYTLTNSWSGQTRFFRLRKGGNP